MTRPLSVSQLKHKSKQLHKQPSGKLGEVYRVFMKYRGLPVSRVLLSLVYIQWHNMLEQLRDFYGLDIRRLPSGEYILAGYTDAQAQYHDFIAERLRTRQEHD